VHARLGVEAHARELPFERDDARLRRTLLRLGRLRDVFDEIELLVQRKVLSVHARDRRAHFVGRDGLCVGGARAQRIVRRLQLQELAREFVTFGR
jgi:hypothetical protein